MKQGQANPVLRPRPVRRGKVVSILLRLATRVKREALPTTHHLGGSPQTHLTTHLHPHAPHHNRLTPRLPSKATAPDQPTHLRKHLEQPVIPMCPWLQKEDQDSVNRRARRVRARQESLSSSTARAKTRRLKTTPLPRLLTLHRRTLRLRQLTSRLIRSDGHLPVLRRHPTRRADSSRMVYPTKLQARPVEVPTQVQTQQPMLAKRTNQQCMPTISLLLPSNKKKCPPLSIPLGQAINTQKAPTTSPDGLFHPPFLPSSAPTQLLNAPG